MKNRITAILLSVLLIVGILPMSGLLSVAAEEDGTALAEFLFYNVEEKVFQKSVCTQYTPVNSTATAWESGWYVADGEIVLESRVSVAGDVFLILKDGCSLTVRGGITVSEGNSLTVFAQSQGDNAGILTADAGNMQECSGIGSAWGRSCGTVNMHGGRITATGGMYASGIGSTNGTDGTVNIYGGNITANSVREGAGIGCGNGGAVNVYGGIVNAGCEDHGTGIDGSFAIFGGNVTASGGYPDGTGFVGTCKINGGTFRANGGYVGTGISGSVETAADIDLINLFDGTKYTKGEGREWTDVFGSGSVFVCAVKSNEPLTYLAYDMETGALTNRECSDYQFIHNNTQTLSGGLYVVTGTLDLGGIQVTGDVGIVLSDWSILSASENYYKAGIEVLKGNTLTVYAQSDGEIAGKLYANGGYQCAGIGGIEKKMVGTVNIHGGVVCATGGANGAGIGGGYGYAAGTVNIYGGIVNANGNDCGAGIGGGNLGPGGNVNIYGGVVNAAGSNGGAGIGGGRGGTGDTVNIYGGTVNATGNEGGAGIGGGFFGYAANVSIFGGKVSADGGPEALAIGNGKNQRENKLGSLTVGDHLTVVNTETGEPIRKEEGKKWLDAVTCHSVFVSDPSEEPAPFEKTDYLAYDNGSFQNRTCEKETYIPCPGLSLWQYEWYVAEGKLTLDAVRIQGDVRLILKDGCELTVQGGINVEAGNRLTIYAQSEGDAAGKLIADGSVYQAGIGSGLDKDCGSIVIEGGNITAHGGACAAGIGGGSGTSYGGDILICSGVVFAQGQDGGAGIGSGYYDYADYDADVMEFTDKATAGNITIRSGNVTAKGSAYAAGIGGGEGSDGGHIMICSGSITAEGGEFAEAAVGDGCFETEDGFVTVYGGTVTALPGNGLSLKATLADGSAAYGSPYKTETDITANIRSASWIHITFSKTKWTENVPNPQTGDAPAALLGMFVLSAAGIAACLVSIRKKRRSLQ